MFWQAVLGWVLAVLAGAAGFWITTTFKPTPTILICAGPVLMASIPPDIAAGLIAGAWLAAAFFVRAREGIAAPNEGIGWRRAVWDAFCLNLGFLVGLIYAYKQRASATPVLVLVLGVSLTLFIDLCFFHTTGWDIPRRLRVAHGYVVGLAAFVPWPFFMARFGWRLLCLSFFTFLLLPPFFLATLDQKLSVRIRRRRRRLPPVKTIRFTAGRR